MPFLHAPQYASATGTSTLRRSESLLLRSAEAVVNDGHWHHVALSVDGAASLAHLRVDGVPVKLALVSGWGGALAEAGFAADLSGLAQLAPGFAGSSLVAGKPVPGAPGAGWLDGAIDDVRLYDGPLTAAQAIGLHAGGRPNIVPWVLPVQSSLEVALPQGGGTVQAQLAAEAEDRDLGPGALSLQWETTGAPPGAVSFSHPDALETSATFGAAGEYLLRLKASDGLGEGAALFLVRVLAHDEVPPTPPAVRLVSPAHGSSRLVGPPVLLWAEAEAAEGSHIASLRFYRNGSPLGAALTQAPWLLRQPEASPGTATYSVVATDNLGRSGTALATVTFLQPGGGGGGGGGDQPGQGSIKELELPAPEDGAFGFPEEFSVTSRNEDAVTETETFPAEGEETAGRTYLVEVVVTSQEYPQYTAPESEHGDDYNDTVSWTITPSWGNTSLSGDRTVNDLHDRFERGNGEAVVGFYTVRFPDEGGTLTFEATVQNVGDGALDTTVEFRLLPVEVISDLNNDGEIDSADNSLRSEAAKPGATEEEIEAGTEYMFINDKLSNGVWDADDDDGAMSFEYPLYGNLPAAPSSGVADDDAQELKVSVGGLDTGVVWFEHPAIDKLEFFDSEECEPSHKIDITAQSPFDLNSDELPDRIWVRLREDWGGTEQVGNLTLLIGKSTNEVWAEVSMLLTVVRDFGSAHFFHAARDYIFEKNTRVCIRDHGYSFGPNPSVVFRLCIMREEATTMSPYVSRSASGLFSESALGIQDAYSQIRSNDNDPAVMINGNQCFWNEGWDEGNPLHLPIIIGNIADRCHGRVEAIS